MKGVFPPFDRQRKAWSSYCLTLEALLSPWPKEELLQLRRTNLPRGSPPNNPVWHVKFRRPAAVQSWKLRKGKDQKNSDFCLPGTSASFSGFPSTSYFPVRPGIVWMVRTKESPTRPQTIKKVEISCHMNNTTTSCTYVCPVFWCWKKKQIPLDSLFNADSEKLGVRAMHQPGENFSLEVKKSLLQPLFWLRKSLGDSNWRKFLNNKQRYKSIK